jgi:hypothetical protein
MLYSSLLSISDVRLPRPVVQDRYRPSVKAEAPRCCHHDACTRVAYSTTTVAGFVAIFVALYRFAALMPRQRTPPREAFLDKLNSYLAAYIVRVSGAGAKISRESIARQLGDYNRVTLYKWLNGSTSMPRKAVEDFCTLVGLSDEERRELLRLGGYIEVLALSASAQAADPAPRSEAPHPLPSGSPPFISTPPLPLGSAPIRTAIISST